MLAPPGRATRRSARRPRGPQFREKPPLPESRLGDEMQEYSLADLKRLFGLPPALIRKLSQAGFITPPAARGKTSYTFQDLLVLRVAGALKAAKISTPKIAEALEKIRSALPSGQIPAIARAASGQYALPLMTGAKAGGVAELRRTPNVPVASLAHDHFRRGHTLEETD